MKAFLLFLLAVSTPFMAGAAPWQPFTAIAASSDGRFLATGGLGGEVLFWELSTGEVLGRGRVIDQPVAGLLFDAAGANLGVAFVGGEGYEIALPEMVARKITLEGGSWSGLSRSVDRWRAIGSPMSGVEASFGALVAQGFPDGRIALRRAPGGEPERIWPAHEGAVTGLVWSQDGAILTSCSSDGSLARWEASTGKLLFRL
jgi:WD40 repeat protein